MADNFPYEDIIDLPPHISSKYPQPTMMDRAARFAPFAAITGYEEMVLEEARVTQDQAILDENELAVLNQKLQCLMQSLSETPETSVTYFLPDSKKAGGSYVTRKGNLRRIDSFARTITFTDGTEIPIDAVSDIESPLFEQI